MRCVIPVVFSPEADRRLVSLQADPARAQLYDRVNDALDAIEDNPSSPAVRRRRYSRPPVWGVPVHGSGEDWLILWNLTERGPFVHYLGEDLR